LAAATNRLTLAGSGEDDAATGDLDIRAPVRIVAPSLAGARATITAAGLGDRIFDLHGPADGEPIAVSFWKVDLRDGLASDDGGAILARAGARLTLNDCELAGNRAGAAGGALWVAGLADIWDCAIRDNATIGGAGDRRGGGAVFSRGRLHLNRSLLSGNHAAGDGGAILAVGEPGQPDALTTLGDVTLAGNQADGEGGGLYAGTILYANNATVSGNRAARGGGLRLIGRPPAAPPPADWSDLWLANLTIAGNRADQGGAGLDAAPTQPAGLLVWARNTALDGNLTAGQPADCGPGTTFNQASRHNLSSDASCTLADPGSSIGAPARLGPLANFVGHRWGHVPLPGSPLIDAGLDSLCTTVDVRGVARPQGPHCDIGAVEVVAPATPSPTPPATAAPSPPPTATAPPTGVPLPSPTPTPGLTPRPRNSPTPIPPKGATPTPAPPLPPPPEQ
jgi:predicted outer membrane repeat protein